MSDQVPVGSVGSTRGLGDWRRLCRVDMPPGPTTLLEAWGCLDESDERLAVVLRGELCRLTARPLWDSLAWLVGTTASLDVDVSAVSFLDAGGARLLRDLDVIARNRGTRLVLRAPSWVVVRVLHILALDRLVRLDAGPAYPSLDLEVPDHEDVARHG